MVISRLLSLITLTGSLLGAFPTFAMGGRFATYASKGRLAALALGAGSGGLGALYSATHKQQKPQFPQFTHDNHPFDLNKVGLAHSLPKKKLITPHVIPVEQVKSVDTELSSAAHFGMNTALGFSLSYMARSQEKEDPLPGALRDTAISVVSQGVGYAVDAIAEVPMELGDEIGQLVHNKITKGAMNEEELKKAQFPSTTKLLFTLGLTWGIFQGLKNLITYYSGYQCACPSLGTGFFATGAKEIIEAITRTTAKAAIVACLIRPAFVMAGVEKIQEPKKKKHKTHQTTPTITPAHAV